MDTETWEVEVKFHLDEQLPLEKRLADSGFVAGPPQHHEDIYLRHPCRDFKASDEALRLRKIDCHGMVTYKGPRKMGQVKVREEIELPLDSTDFLQWQTLWLRLGFQPLTPVKKVRQEFRSKHLPYSDIVVVIDAVDGLGNFVEIEKLVSDPSQLASAQTEVMALAKQLGLERIQPRSYLDQLLEIRGH
jgi:adenylate cyclase class 2